MSARWRGSTSRRISPVALTAKEAVKGLVSATGLIRREVGSRLHLRKTPEMKFIADDSVEHGMQIFEKMREISGGEHA